MQKLNNYLLLGLFSLFLFLPGISALPTLDRDEAHFAQASRQMLQTGNYFQIRFQEGTRFQKPPGINWLQVASVKLVSDAESSSIWPYRLPSFFGALFSALLTYFFARRFVGEKAALLAAALLASTLLLVVEAHMAVIDTSLLSSVVVMEAALGLIYCQGLENKQAHWGWALCFWLAMAYGFVLKGLTPLVGTLSLVTLCLIERRLSWLRGLHFFFGLSLFILLSLAWLLMVNQAEQANYLMQMIHKDLLPKLQGGHESHGRPPLFHLVILPLTFWPASLFLWQGAAYAFCHRHEKTVKFLLAWLLPTWLFFEIMPTKLPQYVLPTFPAIAILCALAITERAQVLRQQTKWLRCLQILWVVLSLGLAASLLSLPYLLMQQWTLWAIVLFAGMALISFIALYLVRRGAYQGASLVVLLLALFSYPLIFTDLLPQLKPLWLSSRLVSRIDQSKISNERPLLIVGFEEPSLVFNLNTHRVKFTDRKTAAETMAAYPSRLAIIEEQSLANWENRANLVILEAIKGYNYSKGKWLKLFLVSSKSS